MAYINKNKIFFAGISKGISERYTEGVIVEDIESEGATSLITFTIDGTSYQAEQGMTWAQWVASDYNTGGCVVKSNLVRPAANSYNYLVRFFDVPNGYAWEEVEPTEKIYDGKDYDWCDEPLGGDVDPDPV